MAVYPAGSASCYILGRSRSGSSFGAASLKGFNCGHWRRRHLSGWHPVFPRPSLLAPPPPLLLAPLSPSSGPSFFSSSCCSSFSSELRTSYSGLGKPLRASPLRRRAKWPRCPPRSSVPWIVGPRSPVACGPPSCFGLRGGKGRLGNPELGLLVGSQAAASQAWTGHGWPRGPLSGGSRGSQGLGGCLAPSTSLASLSGVSSCCSFVRWIPTGPSVHGSLQSWGMPNFPATGS